VRRTRPELAEGLSGELCRALLTVPFRKEGGVLHLAFVVPLSKEMLSGLPPHKAYVALESDIREGLEVCFPKRRPSRETTSAPGLEVPAPQGSIAAPSAASAAQAERPPDVAGFDPALADLALPPPPAPAAPPPAPAARPPAKKVTSSGAPTAEALKSAGLIETGVDPREELLSRLKGFRWHAAGFLALCLGVKLVASLIDFSRNESEKSGAALRQGLGLAAIEAAKQQQRAMQPGGGGIAEAPLPFPTPAGRPGEGPRAGSFDEVSAALAELDVAARRDDLNAFRSACLRVSAELRAYAPLAPAMRQTSMLSNLSKEAAVLCEREYLRPPTAEWSELHGRIMRALTGD
jgi:hypothetical protein